MSSSAPTPAPVTPSPDTEFTSRRESVRQGFLRANRAIGIILGVVLALGVAMAWLGHRARESQHQAEQAEARATERLWNSFVAQARAERLSTAAGHRAAALAAISNAAAIRPDPSLRSEAIAALGMRDLVREIAWPLQPRAYGFHFDPTLEHYLVSYENDALSLFRLADNALARTFRAADAGIPTNAPVREFMFSATGRYAVVLYANGAIVLWERDTGKPGLVLAPRPGMDRPAWPPSFAADDRLFAAPAVGRPRRFLRFTLPDGAMEAIESPEAINESFRLSPRGDVASVFRGRDIRLLDASDGSLRRTLTALSDVITLWWDQQGAQFSISCRDASVHVWNVASGTARQLEGRAVNAWMQKFSPDGRQLATAGIDGTSRLWDLPTGRLLSQTTEGRAFVFGRDGQRIAYGVPGREVGVWRITNPVGHGLLESGATSEASVVLQDLSPDGRWLAWAPASRANRPGFELFDLSGQRPPRFVSTPAPVIVAFHPSQPELFVGSRLGLVAHRVPTLPPSSSGAQSGPAGDDPWPAGPGRSIRLPDGFDPRALSFNQDGTHAVLADAGGRLVVFDPRTTEGGAAATVVPLEGQLTARPDLPGPASLTGSGAVAMSPDGKWVVVGHGTRDGRPTVWNAITGKVAHRLDNESANVAFSPDGRWMATIGTAQCTVWNTETWDRSWTRPRTALLSGYGAGAFSADGTLFAYTRSFSEIELTDPASGERLAGLGEGEVLTVAGLRLARDGRTLAAPGALGRTLWWDLHALRSELGRWRLDWPQLQPVLPPGPRRLAALTPPVIATAALVAVGIAGLLGIVVLRRQRRLTDEFVRTADLAAQRTRELAAERELGELKSRFVSLVSHEFRTPLGITMSAVELLRNYMQRLPPEKLRELLDDIYSATLRMSSLMEQVLLLGRVEAGKISFQARPIDLPVLCGKLVDETYSATNRRCAIEIETAGDLAGAQGDEGLLRHLLSNLLSNAVKYSPNSGTVGFKIQRDGREAIFAIQDRGIGIPEADQPRLFEAFHRATNVGETPGTGLGLLIVRRCVELHQGRITFTSQVGAGTTFTVRLPLFS